MQAKKSKIFVYVRQFRRSHNLDRTQFAIIVACLVIAALASLWLPFYFASQALQSF